MRGERLKSLTKALRDDGGATAIEYGLIAALVSVACIGALTTTGTTLSGMFEAVASAIAGALPSP